MVAVHTLRGYRDDGQVQAVGRLLEMLESAQGRLRRDIFYCQKILKKRDSSRPSHKATAWQATPLGMTIEEIIVQDLKAQR